MRIYKKQVHCVYQGGCLVYTQLFQGDSYNFKAAKETPGVVFFKKTKCLDTQNIKGPRPVQMKSFSQLRIRNNTPQAAGSHR